MSTRTVTKTATKTKVEQASRKGKERAQNDDVEREPPKKKRPNGDGHNLGAASTSKSVETSTSSKARRDPDDADSSSPDSESDDDDFSRDVLEDIAKDIQEREYTKINGKRRKQPAKTKADKQTQKTRTAFLKGQEREEKTSKWARRERQLNPVVKLLKVDFTIIASDSNSSEGSVDTDNADELSDVSREIFNLSHRRQYRRKYGGQPSSSDKKKKGSAKRPLPAKRFNFGVSSDEDGKENPPHSNRSSPSKATAKGGDSSSATEDSDAPPVQRPKKIKAKKQESDQEDVKPDISKLIEEEEDTDFSDDVSPMNPEAYQAQKRRRAERLAQKKARSEGRPYTVKSEPKSPTFSSLPGRSIKIEEEDIKPVLRHVVKQESPIELLDDDDDSDTPPDCAVTDPRYAKWVNRKQASLPQNFQPHIQKTHKPFLEIKSHQQASIGPLVLGKDPQQGNRNVQVPASINRFLRNYQRDGVKFFWKHYAKGGGGLLGDDMGLGKTIQVISFLAAIMGHNCTEAERDRRRETLNKADCPIPEKPTDLGPTALIIAPASVVDNWAREIETWTYLSAGVYRSSAAKEVLRDFKRGRLDILICGIDAARKQIDDICYLDFSCIIVDEVHKVKNPKSKTTLAFKQFACQVRFGLTGTAMQNRYIEMHTVLDWCFPDKLGTPAQWKDYVDTPLKTAQRKDATQEQLALGRERAITLVRELLPNFFIRRTKELIADQLPKKTDQIVFCPLSEDQKKAYCQLLAHPEINTILTHDEACPCGRTDPESGLPYKRANCCDREWYKPILKWISIFCKVANHAVLIYPDKRDRQLNPVKFLQDQQITKCAFPDSYKNRGQDRVASKAVDMDSSLCGKWDVLKGLLARWHEKGDKVLLFSRSTRLLDALEYWIEAVPYNMVRLDGSVPAEKRLSLCDAFNDPAGDKFLFLISTLAGGVGLNLTSANRVVIFDPNWNPVADLQAMDRSYRWGQLRDVTVYRLIGAGSLEELIYSRQIYKQHQAEIAYEAAAPSRMFVGVDGDKRRQGELFGVKNLFRFNPRTSRTKMSIEEAQISELGFALMNHATKSKKRKRGDDSDDDEPVESSQTEDGLVDNEAALEAMLNTGANLKHEEEDDEIARILKNNGVTYTHQHTNLVKNSVVEAQISKAAMRDYKDVKKRGATANQRASTAKTTAKVKSSSSWAPSKGASKVTAANKTEPPNLTPFEMLFEGGQVRMDDLADLAEALDFDSAGGLARAYAAMKPAEQEDLLARAKEIVERI